MYRPAKRSLRPLTRHSIISPRPSLSPALALAHTSPRPTPAASFQSIPSIRLYSQITRRGPTSSSPAYPSDTEYSDSTVYALSYISRVIRYILYGIVALGGVSLATFEGLHLYVEKVRLAAPSRDGANDPYGWIGENQGWTGGSKGGTDPRLGQKARHALRGAWICQEWGAGGSASSTLSKAATGGNSASFHPDYVAVRGMIGNNTNTPDGAGNGGRQSVDRGYELAEEFINLSINEARKKGLVFPPNLSSGSTSAGPPAAKFENTHGVPQGDPTVLDLLLLKAGILERINTTDSLLHAKDLYQQVLSSMNHAQDEQHLHNQARIMRLAGKVGDLSARTGNSDVALKWWSWGLDKAGIQMNSQPASGFSQVFKEVKKDTKGWFGFGKSSTNAASSQTATLPTPSTPAEIPTTGLSPAILRASISLLISASAHLATGSALDSAYALQSQALSLIPPSAKSVSSDLTSSSAGADASLHQTWLQHRAALLRLHQASVLHAQRSESKSKSDLIEPVQLINEASNLSETVISSIQALPSTYTTPNSSALTAPSKLLRRDALLTGAEISYTKAVFLERSLPSTSTSAKANVTEEQIGQLEQAAECFERAMALNVLESGVEKKDGDEVGQGEEWGKYWRGYVRVRGKLGKLVDPPEKAI
ncbi:uncharacterized protein I303_108489 [Kwoniella dejecticola CBS 10117]|uniref:Uncharacterized protein n=1 Tax=Kwoniella dejecticola CBS 10117 TaxID=1296121 RepID=A0A1A5ZX97_9TREE|nr:uncharacterized protein I303_07188 [Kwoniella dejecticola CBS 10117]OBR82429.1 hypothetical protein I303_07188 [Kwoniella dejecticola CBS 10117]